MFHPPYDLTPCAIEESAVSTFEHEFVVVLTVSGDDIDYFLQINFCRLSNNITLGMTFFPLTSCSADLVKLWQVEGVLTRAATELRVLQEERRVLALFSSLVNCLMQLCLHAWSVRG